MNKLIIEAIKTDVGYFVRRKMPNNQYRSSSGLENYYFDGAKLDTTHNSCWLKAARLPETVTVESSQPNINFRYELIDKSFKSKKVPAVIKRKDAGSDDEDGFTWNAEYENLKSLYELKFDARPNLMVEVEFEIVVVLEIDHIKEYGGFSYPVQRTNWAHEGFVSVTDKDAGHDEIDTILFPDIILPARKSTLTSTQSYKIIRKHIQDNIEPKYACITSDYDFCFAVKKKIPLAKREAYQRNVARFGARKPKYVTDYRLDRQIEVFEMSHAESNYKGYTVVEGFKGANVEELRLNIDNYLSDLMELINKPLIDCPNCEGCGVLREGAKKE